MRRKRLELEYKHELLDKLKEKERRQESNKINTAERSNDSYIHGIAMRDQFYQTAFMTQQQHLPYEFEKHKQELKPLWNKKEEKKEGES